MSTAYRPFAPRTPSRHGVRDGYVTTVLSGGTLDAGGARHLAQPAPGAR